MKILKRLYRILYIHYIFLKYGLDEILLSTPYLRPIRFVLFFSPSSWRRIHRVPRGERIRKALEDLGPIFVKFGQALSTRYDALPQDILQELELLQDKVPAFCGNLAEKMVIQSLNAPLDSMFQDFDKTPLASASIAQVHAATLLNGNKVVVKILRPNVKAQIEQDLALLKFLGAAAHLFWKTSRQFKPKEMIKEFERTLYDELDLMREAANASQFRRNFKNSAHLYIPEVHWPLTRTNMLVMERIYGNSVSKVEELKAQNIDLKILAERGVELFFTQVFRDCFFHADMHPGNIWVAKHETDSAKFLAMDFGIMGSLSPRDQRYLAENFLAFFKRDYRRVAELHVESGWVPKHIRVDEFESAIRRVCEPIFEKPLHEISFAQMIIQLFQTATRFQVVIQPQFLLLQKTLLNVESMARKLYPELDIWNTAKPFLENWMRTQMGPQAFISKLKKHGPYLLEKLPELPNLIYSSLMKETHAKPEVVDKPKGILVSKRDLSFGILIGVGLTIAIIFIRSLWHG